MNPSIVQRITLTLLATAALSMPLRSAPLDRSNVLIVKPVILCDDNGENAARHALPKTLADQVYTRGDLEFLYLPPVHWHHGKARRGEINLDTIVKDGHANGMIAKDPRVATLLFVSAVDGMTKPLGRGLQGGNICFVNLGDPDKMRDPAERAFVVAHEIGHCLGMIHAVNDLKVPDDVPNLQGDGPFAERLAVEGLHPSQVKTLRRSPLVLSRRHFSDKEETAKLICEDQWDLPLGTLTHDNLRFELGLTASTSLPEDDQERLAFVKMKYTALATEYTEEDKEQLTQWTKRIDQLTLETWPMIAKLPWHFAKMSSTFCKGRPHTRGLHIVLTDEAMKRFRQSESKALEVLLHEKLHVIQRLMPHHFEAAYKNYGYDPVTVSMETAHKLNFVRNPDAPAPNWAIRHNDRLLLLATSLETNKNDFRFIERAYPIDQATVGSPLSDTTTLDEWRAQFPIRVGHDHPNEVAAHTLGRLFRVEMLNEPNDLLTRTQRATLSKAKKSFAKLLQFPITE
jgi:hypothetical protein